MRLITNADDLGISSEVNAAIFQLMREGLVTSATIMANAPATEEACRLTTGFPACSFGVHLNLTQFMPLTRNPDLARLMSAARDESHARNTCAFRHLRKPILAEWSAQIDRVRSLGVAVSHLDSHHHVHTIPALLPVLKTVLQRHRINRVRLSKNLYARHKKPRFLKRIRKKVFNFLLKVWHKATTTDIFTDLAGFIENRTVIMNRQWKVEVMLHPGATGSDSESSQLKDQALCDDLFRQSLVSYRALS